METKPVGLVVLAAGAGSRFDGPTHKLLAPLRGRPVLLHAVDAAVQAAVGPVAVVSGAVPLEGIVPDSVELLVNDDWAEGQASSLRRAAAWADSQDFDAFVVGLGDQPFVPASCWAAVAGSDADLATAAFDGSWRPPVRIHRRLWAELPQTGDVGARELLRRRSVDVVQIPCEGSAADIDTREDLRTWT